MTWLIEISKTLLKIFMQTWHFDRSHFPEVLLGELNCNSQDAARQIQVKDKYQGHRGQKSRSLWSKWGCNDRYNQVPHLTQDTNGKVTNSQFDTSNESQEVSPFPAGDHKARINRRAQRHSKHKTEQIKNPQKKCRLGTVSKIFYWRA